MGRVLTAEQKARHNEWEKAWRHNNPEKAKARYEKRKAKEQSESWMSVKRRRRKSMDDPDRLIAASEYLREES